MDGLLRLVAVLGRILLAYIFVRAGINKLGSIGPTAAHMASQGIPYANILVWGAVVLELIGGLMLMAGLFARFVALALFFYLIALAVIFHPYWAAPAAAARGQASIFYEHVSMMGGMLYVVAFGAGRCSLDALFGRWRDTS